MIRHKSKRVSPFRHPGSDSFIFHQRVDGDFTCCLSKCSLSAPRLVSTLRLFTRVGTCLMLFILRWWAAIYNRNR